MFLFVLPFSAVAQGDGTLSVGWSLTAADDATSLYSPSGDFAFGFRKVEENDQFLLSIWYDKIPDKTMVWFVNDGTTVPAGSKVQLTADRGLVLSDSRGKDLWSSVSFSGTASTAVLNDTGNFMILGSDSTKVWDSFSNPSDTLLPTRVMDNGGVLYSKRTDSIFSRGRFQLRLLQDGNLVLNTRDIPSDYAYDAYYISGTYDPSNANSSGVQVRFNQTGHMYVVRRNGGISDLNTRDIPSDYAYHAYYTSGTYYRSNANNSGVQVRFNQTGHMYIMGRNGGISDLNTNVAAGSRSYYRATLEFDGVFVLYSHPKVFTGNPNWTAVWSEPENICINLRGNQGSGACGFNSVCRLGDSGRPTCECPKSYSLIDPTEKHGCCKPNFIESCVDEGPSSKEELYDFWELADTDWPSSDYEQLKPVSEVECRKYCLNDCLCAVAVFRGDSCWKKKLPLSNGRYNISEPGVIGTAFIKYRKVDLPQGCPNNRKKDQVAVKRLDRVFQDGDKEFKTEVNVIAHTHQKNLVRLLGYCDDGENRLLIYEYLVNGTLASFFFGDMKRSWTERKKSRTNTGIRGTKGELEKIVENREDMLDEWEKVERFVMVGIWCIQEDPCLRPTMKQVILMLGGVVDVAKPPCPSPFSLVTS
ncbi:hypothetical protein AgCh_031953 [Apium graveolens]